ncbi:pyridoxal phosphate-dependent aminotransferase [Thermodesulforhabdus norvegica]|uniref:Aspartate aminotransferase n=1 Tax=Thermodesulforhabdus norvegica TaxID=39841 RepID=A0A1I4URF9_9BACT|nr:pyridoxal phosphate-dependent aminotransferase [Thermodesulforhabdus norvegica]SFM91546.1 aspartate aminotransferase [Thermodesulforhabdus norvegica]
MGAAAKMLKFMEQSSWIRKMFEEGARLRAIYGSDRVCDFSLGNPNVYPPEVVHQELVNLAKSSTGASHGYMPNAGLPEVREAIAEYISPVHGVSFTAEDIVMTCGAAGAMNVILKALLDPGDEVLVPAPYFVEYGFYADNHGGILKPIPTTDDFLPDLDALENAISPKTKVLILNSPNNPTGQVYGEALLRDISEILSKRSTDLNRPIYIVSDEPYRNIAFDGIEVPSVLKFYSRSIIATSYSKDLCLAGERIGYLAVHPEMEKKDSLLGALVLANRILGFVNAPAFMQRLVARLQGITVDPMTYQKKRDMLVAAMKEIGYEFIVPKGAFYLFPKSPVPDDVEFVRMLQEELILVVPGSGFGKPGYFRIAFCVDDEVISRSFNGFEKAYKKALSNS